MPPRKKRAKVAAPASPAATQPRLGEIYQPLLQNAARLDRVRSVLERDDLDASWVDDVDSSKWLIEHGIVESELPSKAPDPAAYKSALALICRGAPSSPGAKAAMTVLADKVGDAGDVGYLWYLLYVGVPPSGGHNPHGLKEEFVVVQLPADVAFVRRTSYEQQFWWLSSLQALKAAHDWPVGHKQVFCYGPISLQLTDFAMKCWKSPVTQWTKDERERDVDAHQEIAEKLEAGECCPASEAQE